MKILKIILFLLIITNIECAKILGIFNVPSKSHHILGESLLNGLAAKGHDVTMLSPFRSKNPPKNYKDIVIEGLVDLEGGAISKRFLEEQNASIITKLKTMKHFLSAVENVTYNNTIVQNLIKSNEKYDLAIVMWFGNDANLALAQQLAKYTIAFSVIGSNLQITRLTKAPAPSSYVPNLFPHFPDEMTFIERLQNSFTNVIAGMIMFFFSYQQRYVINTHFINTPPFDELYKQVSLVLLNTHYSLESPRPYVPQMVQVGGLHIGEPKPLTGKLKTLMDDAEEGVIFFSLGSNLKSSDIEEAKLEGILKCFSKLPYKVVWKFEKDNIRKLPENVHINNWLPQRDILAHKNTKLFITHGGLLSTTEAIYNGVPMIGIPIYGDQNRNVNDGVVKGYMTEIPYFDLSEEILCSAITEVMNNPKYRNNVKKRSEVFRDQPMKPLDKAVYWVEYVLRHNGAHHLKTTALKLNCFQEYLLDVIVVVVVITFAVIYIARKILKCVRKCVCKKFCQTSPKKKQKKKSKVA